MKTAGKKAFKKNKMNVNIGIPDNQREKIAKNLCAFLADSYTLYLKTQNYHWNVSGPMFIQLHDLFNEQYQNMATAVDQIAERIRSLGHHAPASFHEFSNLTKIIEETSEPDYMGMIKNLVEAHETVVRSARSLIAQADEYKDEASSDLLSERLSWHEEQAWILRNLLE